MTKVERCRCKKALLSVREMLVDGKEQRRII